MHRALYSGPYSAWDYAGLPAGFVVLDGQDLDGGLPVSPCTVLWIGPADDRGLDFSKHVSGYASLNEGGSCSWPAAVDHSAREVALLPQFEVHVRTSDYGDYIDRPICVKCWSTRPMVPPAPTHGPLTGLEAPFRMPDQRELLRGNGEHILQLSSEEWGDLREKSGDFVSIPLIRGLGFISLPDGDLPVVHGIPGLPAVLIAGGSYDEPGQWIPLQQLIDWSYTGPFIDPSPSWEKEAMSDLRRVPGRAFTEAWMSWAHRS